MTPTAVTPAARRNRAGSARPATPHPSVPRTTHRAPARSRAAPRTPRRVSGPASSPRDVSTARAVAAAVAPAATAPARRTAPRRTTAPVPRRISGPTRPARQVDQVQRPLSARALAYLRTLPDHSLLDRVVRGRLWIPLLGVLLVGIVAMQVEVLKLNAGIGHAMVRAGQLQGDNDLLRADVSKLADDQRIESAAARMGMIMPPPSTPRFLSGDSSVNLSRALSNIHQPDATSFAATTSANAAAAAQAAANG